ncbi:BPSL0761 family protein [Pseudomonas sp. GCM10022186]|uniref:BPSL0761 family protein n=1 Tax=Pseudomonas sp. GCM10022186 TaxID=3252650 RepID=UPI003614C8D5
MTLSNQRIQSVYQTWDLLVGLSRNAELPKEIRQEADRLLRHYLYSQKVHPIFPDTPDTGKLVVDTTCTDL